MTEETDFSNEGFRNLLVMLEPLNFEYIRESANFGRNHLLNSVLTYAGLSRQSAMDLLNDKKAEEIKSRLRYNLRTLILKENIDSDRFKDDESFLGLRRTYMNFLLQYARNIAGSKKRSPDFADIRDEMKRLDHEVYLDLMRFEK